MVQLRRCALNIQLTTSHFRSIINWYYCTAHHKLLRLRLQNSKTLKYKMKPFMSAKKGMRSKPRTISTSSSSSAEEIAGIIDILTQILVRLPVKSLIKFKCVSKDWLSLISNRDFCSRHCSSNPNVVLSGIFVERRSKNVNEEYDYVALDENSGSAPFEYLTFVNHPEGIKIEQSCNGLLLCSAGRRRNREYYIYNPTTRQYITLPKPHGYDDVLKYYYLSLAFDPSKSSYYKVVAVFCEYVSPCKIEVYSSETSCWKVCKDPCIFDESSFVYDGGVFWNGAIHWAIEYGICLYFDVEEEELRELPMPPNPDGFNDGPRPRSLRYFGESGDHYIIARVFDETHFDVMEMKRDYSGWFLKYLVNVDDLCSVFPEMIEDEENLCGDYLFIPICIVGEKTGDEESFMVMHIPGKLILYNFKNETLEVLFDYDHDNVGSGSYRFIESLACV